MTTAPHMHEELFNLEWFGGNVDAWKMAVEMVRLAQIWDDLIDGDQPVPEAEIHRAFTTALVYLPMNPFYRQIQDLIQPMWVTTIANYKTANSFERKKDEHGLEIAHGLRFAAGNIIVYAVILCVGEEKAQEYIPELWKCMFNERFDDYRKEHLETEV
jgi:hypothetical protein